MFLAHIRASTGTAVQQTNCHPFRFGKWLWVHNGLVREFPRVKRDLALVVDKSLYASIEGSTDSELLFYLALTLGLEDDPPQAVERMVGLVEETGRRYGIEHPIQMTIGTADGTNVWAFRYSKRGQVALALLQYQRAHAAGDVSGAPALAGSIRGVAHHRL